MISMKNILESLESEHTQAVRNRFDICKAMKVSIGEVEEGLDTPEYNAGYEQAIIDMYYRYGGQIVKLEQEYTLERVANLPTVSIYNDGTLDITPLRNALAGSGMAIDSVDDFCTLVNQDVAKHIREQAGGRSFMVFNEDWYNEPLPDLLKANYELEFASTEDELIKEATEYEFLYDFHDDGFVKHIDKDFYKSDYKEGINLDFDENISNALSDIANESKEASRELTGGFEQIIKAQYIDLDKSIWITPNEDFFEWHGENSEINPLTEEQVKAILMNKGDIGAFKSIFGDKYSVQIKINDGQYKYFIGDPEDNIEIANKIAQKQYEHFHEEIGDSLKFEIAVIDGKTGEVAYGGFCQAHTDGETHRLSEIVESSNEASKELAGVPEKEMQKDR